MNRFVLISFAALAVCFIATSLASATLLSEMIPPPASLASRSTECQDRSNFCTKGKRQGYCTLKVKVVKNFMTKYCKKSCGLCPVKPMCVDKSTYCIYGKKVGQCESENNLIRDYMKRNCKKSCGFCGADKCSDSMDNTACKRYKREGKCNIIAWRGTMNSQCKKTCGLCDLSKTYPCGVSKIKESAGSGTVVGGKPATKGFWPWQAAVYVKGVFKCGGTLVNNRFIVTAAHCITSSNAGDYKIVLGDHNRDIGEGTEQTVGVTLITVHPKYQPKVKNDIAVLKLSEDAVLTTYIVPACLPKNSEGVPAGTKCMISGWGRMTIVGSATNILQDAPLVIEDISRCRARTAFNRKFHSSSMICARNPENIFTSGCHGDSGGPLVCENAEGRMILQGVVSWGSSTCDALERATVFTKVASFKQWIEKVTKS